MRVASLVLVLMLGSPALAGSPCDGVPDLGPLAVEPSIFRMHPEILRNTCDPDFSLSAIFGCADPDSNTIYLTGTEYLEDVGWGTVDIACLEKHEQAHLWHSNGSRWSRDHSSIVSR